MKNSSREFEAAASARTSRADHIVPTRAGALIINADDWGCNRVTTDRTLDCIRAGAVTAVSAMVFMADSERAAELAQEHRVDVGLHLNFTTSYTGNVHSPTLTNHLERVQHYLTRSRLSQVVFHPGLADSFEYLVASQLHEFARLHGVEPSRVDGHHHMHLCANVLLHGLLPAGTVARRNFSFKAGDKGHLNLLYRGVIDKVVARNHPTTDYFFSLPPLQPAQRLDHIFALARHSIVEVETHPVNEEEYQFLADGEIFNRLGDTRLGSWSVLDQRRANHQS